jgi:hypothetical protein
MPGASNTIGLLELPVPAGAQDSALDDPTLAGLLAYLGHWLSTSLDAKFAALRGTTASTAGACPTANRFPWDPATYFVRGDQKGGAEASHFPALYAWRMGRPQFVQHSTVQDLRKQTIGVAYIFDELTLPGAWTRRAGVLNAVDAVFFSAVASAYHPTFGYNGAPLGTPITISLRLSGPGLSYDGGEQAMLAPVPGQSLARGAGQDGHVLRAYPTLRAQFTVHELVSDFMAVDPGDITPEMLLTIKANTEGNVGDAVEIMQRYLEAPDGTELLDP